MNDPSRPKMPGGHDLLAGQNPIANGGRARRVIIFGKGLQSAEISTKHRVRFTEVDNRG